MYTLPLLFAATSSLFSPSEAMFCQTPLTSKRFRRPLSLITYDTPTSLLTSSFTPSSIIRDFFDDSSTSSSISRSDRFLNDFFSDLNNFAITTPEFICTGMPLDIEETNTSYNIDAELPGIQKEDIKIQIKDRILTISGERKKTKIESDKNDQRYRREERATGIVSRSFSLPDNANEDKVSAKYENGVLHVTIDKVTEVPENKKVKTIKIAE